MTNLKSGKKVFSIPKSVLFTAKILEFISTKLATDFAFKLFKTPYKFPRPKREQAMYERAEKQIILIPNLNKNIQVYHCGEGEKKILLVHGWAGRGTQLHAIAEKFAEKGYHAISFDATAHGDSQGKESEMREFMICVLEIDKQFGPFEFAIGHSLGGMTLMNATQRGFRVNKIAIIGSGDSIEDICVLFVEKLGMKPIIGQLLKRKLDKIYGRNIEELSTHQVAKFINIPVLVIHDKYDEEVSVKCAYSITDNLLNHEMLLTEGLGHRKILWDKKVIEKLNHFFTEN